ncbi:MULTISPECIES: DUF3150 domain-containing protein [Methylomonas]|uniref:DUF3150 domain-containing protein n=1 Tax=Methylomonas koyamae TaxID=702114 RepID=A0A177N6B3_9GAMM|nr:DUF3150 domain-containing protein [Methylomonas koyamae]OAI12759.1 hypothetical protein A1355_14050 [Methylomonas koyamae]
MTANQLLDRVVLIKIDANIYGARKKLRKEDLVLADGSELPPEDLASLGSKRLLDPDRLADFNRLKKAAERECLRVGTRFMGGFVVPVEHSADIIPELQKVAHEFAIKKAEFLAGYDAAVRDWIAKHPNFAGIIEKAIDPMPYVATKLGFDFMVVSIRQPEAATPADIERLDRQIDSIGGQLFHEIAVDAELLLDQSLIGKDQVTRNAVRPIKRIRDKLDGLGFIDYRVAPIVTWIDGMLQKIPKRGAIDGPLLQEILAMAMLLADPDKLRRHGEGLLSAQPVVADDESVTTDDITPVPVQDALDFVDAPPTAAADDRFAGLFDDLFETDEPEDDLPGTASAAPMPEPFIERPALAAQASDADIHPEPEPKPNTAGTELSKPAVAEFFWF